MSVSVHDSYDNFFFRTVALIRPWFVLNVAPYMVITVFKLSLLRHMVVKDSVSGRIAV